MPDGSSPAIGAVIVTSADPTAPVKGYSEARRGDVEARGRGPCCSWPSTLGLWYASREGSCRVGRRRLLVPACVCDPDVVDSISLIELAVVLEAIMANLAGTSGVRPNSNGSELLGGKRRVAVYYGPPPQRARLLPCHGCRRAAQATLSPVYPQMSRQAARVCVCVSPTLRG